MACSTRGEIQDEKVSDETVSGSLIQFKTMQGLSRSKAQPSPRRQSQLH